LEDLIFTSPASERCLSGILSVAFLALQLAPKFVDTEPVLDFFTNSISREEFLAAFESVSASDVTANALFHITQAAADDELYVVQLMNSNQALSESDCRLIALFCATTDRFGTFAP
jgi:hypothetical protein